MTAGDDVGVVLHCNILVTCNTTQHRAVHNNEEVINMLKVIFPAMMVLGATGSLIVNIAESGDFPISLQWIGAAILYTALLLRNIK